VVRSRGATRLTYHVAVEQAHRAKEELPARVVRDVWIGWRKSEFRRPLSMSLAPHDLANHYGKRRGWGKLRDDIPSLFIHSVGTQNAYLKPGLPPGSSLHLIVSLSVAGSGTRPLHSRVAWYPLIAIFRCVVRRRTLATLPSH